MSTVGLLLDWVEPGLRDHLLAMADYTGAEFRYNELGRDYEEATKELPDPNVDMSTDERAELQRVQNTFEPHLAQAEDEVAQCRDFLLQYFGDGPVFIPEKAYEFASPHSSNEATNSESSAKSVVEEKSGEKRSREADIEFTPPQKHHRTAKNSRHTTEGNRSSRSFNTRGQSSFAASEASTHYAPFQGAIRNDYPSTSSNAFAARSAPSSSQPGPGLSQTSSAPVG